MSKARILAVDDQRYFRELIEGLLADDGYQVQTASSGEEALHIFEREDFEVVITDLVMPGIDGRELVRKIKERRPEQDVVMVTGVVDVQTAVDAMKQGATDYILKPFDRLALSESIDKILQRRRLRVEHARLMEENLEFMGLLSLFERAVGLFSTLAVGPLAERLIEGLCLETRAQTGVLWVAEEEGGRMLRLVGARGLVRVDGEPERVELEEVEAAWCPGLLAGRSVLAVLPEDADGAEALYVPIRTAGETIGVVRLADRLDGESFADSDRAAAEKFCELGGVAICNAMRFGALERRSLRDPDTRAYSRAYFDDAVRNEVQKANRFGQRFSILRIGIDPVSGRAPTQDPQDVRAHAVQHAHHIEGALRGTDLLASGDAGVFYVLMPQTDALGAGILVQRIRQTIREADVRGAQPRSATVTFPTDGTQPETLFRVLDERTEQSRESLLSQRPELMRSQPLDPLLDRMLELGTVEPMEIEGQILRFVLEDVVRRPADRGVLFVSPGARWLPEVLETLHEVRGLAGRTQIVLLSEGEEREDSPQVTWITKSGLDSRRPFIVYFGDGPAYAMVGQVTLAAASAPIFQTADRALVEHLTFELMRELGIALAE
ncbi:MAG: hypothetical protein CL908_09725 [Deltaproteobacteria bacterium]|nr:hypothetical protein [Deltaproteobacteria bacterium]